MTDFTGTPGNDSITGTSGDDTINGDGGNDRLVGDAGNDAINGGDGADYITGSNGDDVIDGGAGIDRAGYYQADPALGGATVSLLVSGPQNTGSQGMDTLTGIENLSGTPFADILTGDNNDNWLWGAPATLTGGVISATNNDTLDGQGGNDLLTVGIGNHTLIGGSGVDTVRFTENGGTEPGITIQIYSQGAPQDTGAGMWTLTGIENLSGGIGNDLFEGNSVANVLAGDLGNDQLFGYGGDDLLLGDGRINVDANGVITTFLDSGTAGGNDSLYGGGGNDTLYGGAGLDSLYGGVGNDSLYGGDGNDFLKGDVGDDTIDGGAGYDRASFFLSGAVSGVTVDLRIVGPQDTGRGMDTLVNVENVSGTSFADTLTGDDNDNWLWGSAVWDGANLTSTTNDDTIDGGGGNDLLTVGQGNHNLTGGAGIDTVTFTENTTLVTGLTLSLALQGAAQATGYGNWLLSGFENLSGSVADDTLTGDGGVNVLAGDTGNDTLSGGAGNDTLYGDGQIGIDFQGLGGSGPITTYADVVATFGGVAGNDILEGGLGDDLLNGGGGSDTASYANASGGVTAFLYKLGDGNGEAFGADGNDTLAGIENLSGSAFNDNLGGNNLANVLDGGDGDDGLRGNGGNDTLLAGNGNDFLNGGLGDDTIDGGAGFDRAAFYTDATTGVTVNLNLQGVAQNTGQGMDTLVNIENLSGTAFGDTLTGDNGDNWLWGSASTLNGIVATTNNDTLTGGGGNDLLTVGIGNHVLDGGTGNDTVSFTENGAPETGITVSLALQGAAQATGNGSWTLTGIENLSGGIANDTLTGDANANILAGYTGNDSLSGGTGNDILYGDGVIVADNRPTGGSGPITTFTDALLLDPTLVDGNDILEGGLGDDTLDGGGGIDTASYANAGGSVTVDLGFGVASGADGNDTLVSIENVIGSEFADNFTGNGESNVLDGLGGNDGISGGAGDDTISGGDGDDFLQGDFGENNISVTGNDILYGGNGNDTLRGGLGNDQLYGGANNDLLRGNGGVDYFDGGADDGEGFNGIGDRVSFYDRRATQGVVADLRTGIISNDGFGNVETMVGIESLGGGTAFADTFYGNDDRNFLGGDRGDQVYGFGGDDIFQVTSAAAVIDGGAGRDRLNLFSNGGWLMPDANADGLAEVAAASSSGWTVNLSAGTTADGQGNSGTVSGIEDINGSHLGDTLTGDANANVLNGFDGDDTLEGRLGNDTLDGGNGIDTATYASASGSVQVDLGTGTASGADGNDTLVSIENVIGSGFNDVLVGDANANSLDGGLGNDTLYGSGGNDVLNGGDGDDRIDGGTGSDQYFGGNGDDTLIQLGAANGEVFNGGAGTDTLEFQNSPTPVPGLLGPVTQIDLFNSSFSSIEHYHFNSLAGTSMAVRMLLSAAAPNGLTTLTGGAGYDTLILVALGGGAFTMPTLTRVNWNSASNAYQPGDIVILAANGNPIQNYTLNASAGHAGVEMLVGAGGNDTLNGTDGMEALNGGGGFNQLNGGGGNDALIIANGTPNVVAGGVVTPGALTNFTGSGCVFDGGDGTDYLSVGGVVNFQGTLVSIEGIFLQSAFTSVTNIVASQVAAELHIDGSVLDGLPSNLGLDGTGTIVVDLDPGDTFDGSGYVIAAGSAITFSILGSDVDDLIVLTAVNDSVDGGLGQDVVQFSGNRADYAASAGGAVGAVAISGVGSGNDSFVNVEVYRFADGDFVWDAGSSSMLLLTSGVLLDGYIAFATIFIDIDRDGTFDSGAEPFTISDANGNFVLASNAVGPLRAIGGTNIDTGLANVLTLSAPQGSSVINPLTTLVEALVAGGLTEGAAEAKVLSAFGLDSTLDLTTFDMLAAPAGDLAALAAQKAAASIAEILNTIVEAAGVGGTAAQTAGVTSLAGAVLATNAANPTVDLTDNATLTDVLTDALPGLPPSAIAELAAATEAVNTAIDSATDLGDVTAAQGNAAPTILALVAGQTNEDAAVTTINLLTGALDADGDTLSVATIVSAVTGAGQVVTTSLNGNLLSIDPAQFNALAAGESRTITVTYRVSDGNGGLTTNTATLVVNGVNDGPAAANDSASVVEDRAVTGNVRSNDSDPDTTDVTLVSAIAFGATAGAVGVPLQGLYGTLTLNANGTYSYAADADYLDTLRGVTGLRDVFSYTISDGHGGTSTATLTVNVSLASDERTINGTVAADIIHGDQGGLTGAEDTIFGGKGADQLFGADGSDTLWGGGGDDRLSGGQSRDTLYGEDGNDTLDGGVGDDRLAGGGGNDRLTGGTGADTFVFAKLGGADTITDFQSGIDHLQLDGTTVKSSTFSDVDRNGTLDLVLQLSSGSVTLLNVSTPLPAGTFVTTATAARTAQDMMVANTGIATNTALVGAVAAAGLAAAPAADALVADQGALGSFSAGGVHASLVGAVPVGIPTFVTAQTTTVDALSPGIGGTSVYAFHGETREAVPSFETANLVGGGTHSTAAPRALLHATDAPVLADYSLPTAAGVMIPANLHMLGGSDGALARGAPHHSNEVLSQVLADALHGGGGPDIDALLQALPGADHGARAATAVVVDAMGDYSGGWAIAAMGGFSGHLPMEALAFHPDAMSLIV